MTEVPKRTSASNTRESRLLLVRRSVDFFFGGDFVVFIKYGENTLLQSFPFIHSFVS